MCLPSELNRLLERRPSVTNSMIGEERSEMLGPFLAFYIPLSLSLELGEDGCNELTLFWM